MKPLALIVAYARANRGIGLGNALPWRLPEDLKRFKALTTGHAIIMGRKTFESIGRPLPNRRNVVISRQPLKLEGCDVVGSLDAALALVADDPMPFICGGAQIYALALPKVTHLFVTEVDQPIDADAFFPPLEAGRWREVERAPGQTPGVTFVNLVATETEQGTAARGTT